MLGLDAPIEEHLAMFKAKGIEKVLIAFRRAVAGDNATKPVAEKLGALGIDALRPRARRSRRTG